MRARSSSPGRAERIRLSVNAGSALSRAIFPSFRRDGGEPAPLPPTAEELREIARANAAVQGLLEGRAEGIEQASVEIAALRSALEQAAAALTARAAALASDVERALPAIITTVVRKVLHHELADDAV